MNCQETFLSCVNCQNPNESATELECQHSLCIKCINSQLTAIENRIRVNKVLKCNYCRISTIVKRNEIDKLVKPKSVKKTKNEQNTTHKRIENLTKRLHTTGKKSLSNINMNPLKNDFQRKSPITKSKKAIHAFNTFQKYKDSIVTFTNISSRENISKALSMLTNNNNSMELDGGKENQYENLNTNDFKENMKQPDSQQKAKENHIFISSKNTLLDNKTSKSPFVKNNNINNKKAGKNNDLSMKKIKPDVSVESNGNRLKEIIASKIDKIHKEENTFESNNETTPLKKDIMPKISPSKSIEKQKIIDRILDYQKYDTSVHKHGSVFRSIMFDYKNMGIDKTIDKLEETINDTTNLQYKNKQQIMIIKDDTNKIFENILKLIMKKQNEYNELFDELVRTNTAFYTNKYKDDTYFLKEYIYINTDIENNKDYTNSKELHNRFEKLKNLHIENDEHHNKLYDKLNSKMQVFETVKAKFKTFYTDCVSLFNYDLFDDSKTSIRHNHNIALDNFKLEENELIVLKSVRNSHKAYNWKPPKERNHRLSLDLKKEKLNKTLNSFYFEKTSTTQNNHQNKLDTELKRLKLMLN